jgi:hypothetical protein
VLKGVTSRLIYWLLDEELLSEIDVRRCAKNSPNGATDSGGNFRTSADRVCCTSLKAFIVVIPVLDLRGGLW